jgi:hypothetical protein
VEPQCSLKCPQEPASIAYPRITWTLFTPSYLTYLRHILILLSNLHLRLQNSLFLSSFSLKLFVHIYHSSPCVLQFSPTHPPFDFSLNTLNLLLFFHKGRISFTPIKQHVHYFWTFTFWVRWKDKRFWTERQIEINTRSGQVRYLHFKSSYRMSY